MNASDSSSGYNVWTGTTWWSGSNNSRVTIQAFDPNPSTLVVEDVKVYRQDDEANEASPGVKYVFNTLWDILSANVPFPVPKSPHGLIVDHGEKTGKEIGVDKAVVTFNDPHPSRDSEDSVTHAMDWKYSIYGSTEPGWHLVNVTREVENGYYQQYRRQANFESELKHQNQQTIGPCFYESDVSICDETDMRQSPYPDATSCVELTTSKKFIPISDSHLQSARSRAASSIREIDSSSMGRFSQKAESSQKLAEKTEGRFHQLVAHRSATAHAEGARAYKRATNGKLDLDKRKREISDLQTDIDECRKNIRYTGRSLNNVVAATAQIEKSLWSAQIWLNQASEILGDNCLPRMQQARYATSALEFARGTYNDARHYRSDLSSAEEQQARGDTIDTLFEQYFTGFYQKAKTEEKSRNGLERSKSEKQTTRYARQCMADYVERGTKRFQSGYKSIAVLDLLIGNAVIGAVEALDSKPLSGIDEDTLTIEQELTIDRYHRITNQDTSSSALPILNVARLEIGDGNVAAAEYEQSNNLDYRHRAYAHYRVANALIDSTDDIEQFFKL